MASALQGRGLYARRGRGTDPVSAVWLTLRLAEVAQDGGMTNHEYTRSTGLRLTYRIRADERGWYTVYLGDKELLRGRDPLSAGGMHRTPSKRKVVGAVHQAKLAIESLSQMPEC